MLLRGLLLAGAAGAAAIHSGQCTGLEINDRQTNDSSPLLYGLFLEDINHSVDGGLYGELLMNRAFQGPSATTEAYSDVNGPALSVGYQPLSDALPFALHVEVPPTEPDREIGFVNAGYFGINVTTQPYNVSFYAKVPHDYTAGFNVSLRGIESGINYAQDYVKPVSHDTLLYPATSNGYQRFTATIEPCMAAPNTSNGFYLTWDSTHGANTDFWFDIISLMPSHSFNDRENGNRVDLMETLKALNPSVFRFPGGNNLEGQTIPQRWQWNETIGPITERPGRLGDWSYPNTDGMGLLEYLYMIEDLGARPIMAVYDGYSLEGYAVPDGDLDPYIQSAIDQIEYVIGDASSTKHGALRAKHGHPEPFDLQHVEIGNEDFLGIGVEYRFPQFYSALKKAYPQLTFIATTEVNVTLPDDGTWWDQHYYESPAYWQEHFSRYDNWPRNNTPIYDGEYATTNQYGTVGDGLDDRLKYPTIQGAVGEAVYMTGMERNSDLVVASCYAPLLQNVANYQWTPDLIQFDAAHVYNSASYYVQQLWSVFRGTQILNIDNSQIDPLYYVAAWNNASNHVYIKIANPSNHTVEFSTTIDISDFHPSSANCTAVSNSDPLAVNTANSTRIEPYNPSVSLSGSTLSLHVSPYFAGVVQVSE